MEARESRTNEGVFYHYTNIDSFVKILSSGKFYASNALNMNDSEELSFAVHATTGYLLQNLEQSEKRDNVLRFLKFTMPEHLSSDTYLISLSNNSSQLSQWRAYAQPEGISFGWHEEKLQDFAKATGGRFFRVAYDWNEQQKLVEPIIQKTMANFDESWLENPQMASQKYRDILKGDFDHIAPMMKHAGFKEEQEARLVWDNDGRWPVHFFARNIDIKPYIEIDAIHECTKIIDNICVGPTLDIDRRFFEICKVIDTSRFEWCSISGSGIPYQKL